MMCAVLKHYHVMISIPFIELHQAILPPSFIPVPKVPHMAGAVLYLGPWGALAKKANLKEYSSSGGIMMSQGTDIGNLIPHYNVIPPAPLNALLPIIILTSGSKSHFGSHAHIAPKGPIAAACLSVVQFNLNCAGPASPPLPAGMVIPFNTHLVGMSPGDWIAGFLHMVVDGGLQYVVNQFFSLSKVSGFFEDLAEGALKPFMRALGSGNITSIIADAMERSLPKLGRWLGQAAEELLFAAPGAGAGLLLGSPLGYSPGWSPIGGGDAGAEDAGHEAAQKAIDKYLGTSDVEEFPSGPGDFPPPDQNAQPA
ncbi:MAG TPA: hypothetical protein VHO67_20920 [Polyangia bacterium]|nr:hypothetical protein [Polyangia bacterium]